jgi:phosphopantothenoylcysteine decarboxylase/phosphopantothenate--cysteine ligase
LKIAYIFAVFVDPLRISSYYGFKVFIYHKFIEVLDIPSLSNKKIILGVSGSIASYKAIELLRLLINEGARVDVAMSLNATKFITPLTFEALSGNSVYSQVFNSDTSLLMEHIQISKAADLLLIAPATAGVIGKISNGIVDDALSNLYVSYSGPILIAPAMNDAMYANPAVKSNIVKMKDRGIQFIEPEHGELACGSVGQGRLADPLNILETVRKILSSKKDFHGLRILVTAGPTQESLDPVRFITNPSSGKMGYAIACAARDRGANVTLISGPCHLTVPAGLSFISCRTANEMNQHVENHFLDCNVLIMSAAVGDFAPNHIEKEKIKKKNKAPLSLELLPTEDILQNIIKFKTKQFVVGFAAESENITQSALEKLRNKDLDLIVANDISSPGIGFQSDSNQVTLIKRNEEVKKLPTLPKIEIAHILLNDIRSSLTGFSSNS